MTAEFKPGDRVKILGTIKAKFAHLNYDEKVDAKKRGALPKGNIVIEPYYEEETSAIPGLGKHLANHTGIVLAVRTHSISPDELEDINTARKLEKKSPKTEQDFRLSKPRYAVLLDEGKGFWLDEDSIEGTESTAKTEAAQARYNKNFERQLAGEFDTYYSQEPVQLYEVFRVTKDTTSYSDVLTPRGSLHYQLKMRLKTKKGLSSVMEYLEKKLLELDNVERVLDEVKTLPGGKLQMYFQTKGGDIQSFIIWPKARPTELVKIAKVTDAKGKVEEKFVPSKSPRVISID